MNSRRKFLIRGGMTTTALIAARSFETFAQSGSSITGFNANANKLLFLHTGNFTNSNHEQAIKHIIDLKNKTGNVVVLHTGDDTTSEVAQFKYDASINHSNAISSTANNYRIIYKGKIKMAVISAGADEADVIQNVNKLCAWLKKEKDCHIVICLSQLGYKAKNNVDDVTLAASSTSLDMIIGGHAKNYAKHPSIILNKNNEEVIINHAAENTFALGKIEIDFDNYGRKRNIAFADISKKSNEENLKKLTA